MKILIEMPDETEAMTVVFVENKDNGLLMQSKGYDKLTILDMKVE